MSIHLRFLLCKNACWGAPKPAGDFWTPCPEVPLSAAPSLPLLGLILPPSGQVEEVVDVGLDRHVLVAKRGPVRFMGQSQQYTGVIKSGRAIKMTHRELQGICKSRLWVCGRGRLGGVRQQIIHCHAEEVCDTLEVIDCGRRHAPLTYDTVAEPSRLLKLRYANVPALAKCGNIGKHQRLHPLLFQVF